MYLYIVCIADILLEWCATSATCILVVYSIASILGIVWSTGLFSYYTMVQKKPDPLYF